MEKTKNGKKRYIFMPNGIPGIGGAELYILGKQRWLKNNNWVVHVLSSWYSDKPYKIKELDVYRAENMPVLNSAPFECSENMRMTVIHKMMELVNGNEEYETTIIESHTGSAALWGELLAERINAKHVISLINESFDAASYKEKIDFFLYKYNKKELMGGLHAHQMLFGDVMKVSQENILTFKLQEDPVQDISDDRLGLIGKTDYTICYLGRCIKPYFPDVLKGVESFSREHQDSTIQFVIVGETLQRKDLVCHLEENTTNVRVVLMGDMFPLPRELFKRLDAVIAGSGSARCSAYEGVPTIVADPDNCMANGILGYDTIRSIGRDSSTRQRSFKEALEEVLISREVLNSPFVLPPFMTVEECCVQNMRIIGDFDAHGEYYDTDDLCCGKASMRGLIKAYLSFYMPKLTYLIAGAKDKAKRKKK